jgi:hypothetical protein
MELRQFELILKKTNHPILGRVNVHIGRSDLPGLMYQIQTGQRGMVVQGKRPSILAHRRNFVKYQGQIWHLASFFEYDSDCSIFHEVKDPLLLQANGKPVRPANITIAFIDPAA